jgi:cell division protein FtsA
MLSVGGAQVTNDLSIMLSIPMDAAERLKRESASAWLQSIENDETVIVPGVGGRAPVETPRRRLASIVQPRMEEVFGMVRERVEKMGHWNHIKGGVVLTGGGALMQGAAELAQEMFRMPVRIGNPITLGGLVEEYRSPLYATAVGLILLGAEGSEPPDTRSSRQGPRGPERQGKGKSSEGEGTLSRIAEWIRKGFF